MTEEVTEAIELLARLEEIGGNKAGAFTLRSVGAVGTLFEAKLEAVIIALRGLTINDNPFTPEEEAELVDQINGSYYLQSNSPTTNGEVSEPPLKSEGCYHAGGGHAPASGSRDGSEILAPAMEAARIPAAHDDVERVARAMKRSAGYCSSMLGKLSGQFTDYDWNWLAEAATEALEAAPAIPIPATGEAVEQAYLEGYCDGVGEPDSREARYWWERSCARATPDPTGEKA